MPFSAFELTKEEKKDLPKDSALLYPGQLAFVAPGALSTTSYVKSDEQTKHVVGVQNLHKNLAIFFYNPITHKVAVANIHIPNVGDKIVDAQSIADRAIRTFTECLHLMTHGDTSKETIIKVHVVGAAKSADDPNDNIQSFIAFENDLNARRAKAKSFYAGGKTTEDTASVGRSKNMDIKSPNFQRFHVVSELFEVIKKEDGISLETFDVYDIQKPHAVALDAKNGKLIQGSMLFSTEQQAADDIKRHATVNDLTRFSKSPDEAIYYEKVLVDEPVGEAPDNKIEGPQTGGYRAAVRKTPATKMISKKHR